MPRPHHFFFVIALFFIGVGWWYFSRNNDPKTVTPVTPFKAASTAVSNLYQGPRRKLIPTPLIPKSSSGCLAFFSQLRETDMGELFAEGSTRRPPAQDPKCDSLPKTFHEIHRRYVAACSDYSKMDNTQQPSVTVDSIRRSCQVYMLMYRAQISEWLTRDVPLEKISDPKVLADKAIARFADDPEGASNVADRLMEITPNYPAAKLSALARFLDARRKALDNETDPRWDKAAMSIQRAREMDPKDAKIYSELELGIEIARTRDPRRVREKAEALLETDPALGHYFAAWADNEAGDPKSALAHLAQAMQVDPNDERFRMAYDAIAKARPGEIPRVFQTPVALPIELIEP